LDEAGKLIMPHVSDRQEWLILERLCDPILSAVDGPIIDLGIGMSTKVLAEFAQKYDREQYSCDKDMKVIKRYNCPLHKKHTVVNEDSMVFVLSLTVNPSIVFIDDDHRHQPTINKVLYFLDRMEFGSVIFLHDTFPKEEKFVRESGRKCGNVYKTRQELEKNDSVWTFTWPYLNYSQGHGLTMIMRKPINPPYYWS